MKEEELEKKLDQLDELFSSVDERLLRLAKEVADLPPPLTDTKSIEEWAATLAADIAKGKD